METNFTKEIKNLIKDKELYISLAGLPAIYGLIVLVLTVFGTN